MKLLTFCIVTALFSVASTRSFYNEAYNPCRHKELCGLGICEPSRDFQTFTCRCQYGFTGQFCEIKLTPSCNQRAVPCKNNGICHDTLNGITCECPNGTYGRRCEILDEKAEQNWGTPSIEDINDVIGNVPKGYKSLGYVGVNKVTTLKELKQQLKDLSQEIERYRDVKLEVVTLPDGTTSFYDVIHHTNATKDDVATEWKALLVATVKENDYSLTLDDVIAMMIDPVFPSHFEPQELRAVQKPKAGYVSYGILALLCGAVLTALFGGLLYASSQGAIFKYGTIKRKNNIENIQVALKSETVKIATNEERVFESYVHQLCNNFTLDPSANEFLKGYSTVHNDNAIHELCHFSNYSEESCIKAINYLIQLGIDVNHVNKMGKTPLDLAAACHRNKIAINCLLPQGAKVTAHQAKKGFTVLHECIVVKNTTLANHILTRVDALALFHIATPAPYPQSAMTLAACWGMSDLVESLMRLAHKNGFNVGGIVNREMERAGWTALHWAAAGGHVDCVKRILDTAKSIKILKKNVLLPARCDYMHQIALQTAVENKFLDVAAVLLEYGSDPNHTDYLRRSSYTMAADIDVKTPGFKAKFDEICKKTNAPEEKAVKTRKRIAAKDKVEPAPKRTTKDDRHSFDSCYHSDNSVDYSNRCSPEVAQQWYQTPMNTQFQNPNFGMNVLTNTANTSNYNYYNNGSYGINNCNMITTTNMNTIDCQPQNCTLFYVPTSTNATNWAPTRNVLYNQTPDVAMPINNAPVRGKAAKFKPRIAPKNKMKSPSMLALDNFDFYYSPLFGKRWPSVRLGLLTQHKYVAVLNRLSEDYEQNLEVIRDLGTVDVIGSLKRGKGFEKVKEKVAKTGEQVGQEETGNVIEGLEEEDKFVDRVNGGLDEFTPSGEDYESGQVKQDVGEPNSNQIQITGLEFLNSHLKTEEGVIEYPSDLRILSYARDVFDNYPAPMKDKNGISSWWLLDGGSVLPVLALDLKDDDNVLDMCASPGGKSLMVIQSGKFASLTCNDAKLSRFGQLRRGLAMYIPVNAAVNEKIILKRKDASLLDSWDEENLYDKVLVDAPCSTDRLAATDDEGNLFSPGNTQERLNLPQLQTRLLINAIRSLRVGGSVVYSTCTMSPAQNESVVENAAILASEHYGIEVVEQSLNKMRNQLMNTTLFRFSDKATRGLLVVPNVRSNFGPMFVCKLVRKK
ncbi:unnamed protein product [Bursaphelenchus okinawaensis]|uniref:NOL1/NOP2/Sun domain family member 4 n=1 Tax=Bursaphelenchus okinawaensis TaxID=465554 RepID=A0A811K5C6_9BILA|nr:unnamed protein product [Bursaphelenchus okinawaensis]CAG9091645.1 unnamed protein product [Bursaphelenchus okinawaensis]